MEHRIETTNNQGDRNCGTERQCTCYSVPRGNRAARYLLGIGVLTTGCGISATYNYSGTGLTHDLNEREVQILGEISTCQGAGCNGESSLSLTFAPPASNYQAALRKKAAKLYSVAESQVVLGEITVRFSCNELLGTVRGWQAHAIAGKKTLSEDGMSTSRPALGQTNTH